MTREETKEVADRSWGQDAPAQRKFRVGLAHDPQQSDPTLHDERDAIEAASKLHHNALPFGKETVAIWDESGGYLYLFFDGEQFRRT